MKHQNGKGDSYRKLDGFGDGYDRIFGRKTDGKLQGSATEGPDTKSEGEAIKSKEAKQASDN